VRLAVEDDGKATARRDVRRMAHGRKVDDRKPLEADHDTGRRVAL
jgi:hypothetical protein